MVKSGNYVSGGVAEESKIAIRDENHDGEVAESGRDRPVAPQVAITDQEEAFRLCEQTVSGLEEKLAARDGSESKTLIAAAYQTAKSAHAGQFRLTGEPYVSHSVAVAKIVADLGLDTSSVVAALLHDVIEDTEVTKEEIERDFGSVVAELVDGVTKLDRLHFSSKEAQQAATVRKMLVSMAKDWRVLVIKLCDRMHNMRTISAMPEWKQQRTARQTMDIYAPLAHRLGMEEIKSELEDLSFKTLHPKRYLEIEQMVSMRTPRRAAELEHVLAIVKGRLAALNIAGVVSGRPKHLWSIYEKMVVRGKEFNEIYDLIGIRIIVESEKDCWAALGSVHSLWTPVPGRFKDYINQPKFNLYQSLHTTVVGPGGKPVEIQIRTEEMHRRAEYGIAAHWEYKETPAAKNSQETQKEMAWLNRIADLDRYISDPIEFLESLKLDLQQDEVFVFTPKGAIVTLPANTTPVDFAYAIHTEIGHRCVGARVDGRLVSLDTKLKSGQTVEIFTSKLENAGPSRDWLSIVVSPRARNKIRQWFSKERREDAIEAGREELTKALRREGLPVQKFLTPTGLASIISAMGYDNLESLLAAIGEGHHSGLGIVQRIEREMSPDPAENTSTLAVKSPHMTGGRVTAKDSLTKQHRSVYVEGLDDIVVRLSKCCSPVPGDPIIGFVTRGHGVSVHRDGCVNAQVLAAERGERLIEVEWGAEKEGIFLSQIEIKGLDRSNLLADVTRVLAEHHVGIVSSSSQLNQSRVSLMKFEGEFADTLHLESVLTAIRQIEGVYDAYRSFSSSQQRH